MSNFNKVVTNIPVSLTETEMSNLSQTFSGIIQGGGGGGEGKRYIGDGVYVTVNNDANPGVIALTQTSLEKLNKEIPSAVSSFPDSVQYAKKTYVDSTFQTKEAMSAYATTVYVNGAISSIYYTNILGLEEALNAKQDKLTFGYDENDSISSINSHKLAGAGGVTGDYYSASNPSGFINSAQAETQILEKHYLTEASGNARYIPIPEGLSDNQYYAYTTSSWKVIQGAGEVSGISTVAHDDTLTGNGNQEALGVDFTKVQTKLTDAEIQNITDVTTLKTASSTWNEVSAKLNISDFNTYTATTAPATYQPIGNYLSSNALEGYATQQWVGQQGYITQETDWTNTIQEASAKAYNDATANANSLYQAKGDYVKNTDIGLDSNNKVTAISGKELIITAHQSLTNYYTKDETSGAAQISAALAALPGGGITEVTHDTTLTGKGNSTQDLGVAWSALSGNTIDSAKSAGSATSALSAENAESARYTKQLKDASKIIQIGDITALQNWASSNSSTWDAVSAKLGTAQYANDSATFVTSSNASISAGGEQYALTTTGWAKIQAGSTLTAGSGVEIVSNGINALLGTDLAFNATTSAIQINTNGTAYGARAFVEGTNTTASGEGAHAEGADAGAIGLGSHAGGYGTHTTGVGNFIHGTFLNFASPDGTSVSNTPVFVGGTLNYTTAQNYNDHGGYLQIMGNGSYTGGGQGNNSDAYILYRDGSISAAGKISANGMFAVDSAATLIGASRQTSSHYGVDNTALGTTWMGVSGPGMHQGFIKYTDGGDVGALDTTSTIQINIKPENAGYNGEMTITNVNGETTSQSKVVNVPTASYNNMSVSSQDGMTTGPNYFVVKTASGFDIGAAVINVTAMPSTTQSNTYYFIYET